MIYFNVAGLCPFKQAVQQEVSSTLEQFSRLLYSKDGIHIYQETLQHCRHNLAHWLHLEDTELVAFAPNATTASRLMLSRLPWTSGDHILTTTHENSTVLKEILALQRQGVHVHTIDPRSPAELETEVEQLLKSTQARAIVISHVSHIDGRIFPIECLQRLTQNYQALLIVDGAQAVGHIPVDFRKCQPDAYFFPGHKWCAGPMGTGAMILGKRFLKCAEIFQPETDEHPLPWVNFELGTQNIGLIAGLDRACRIKKENGLDSARQEVIRKKIHRELTKMHDFNILEWDGPHSPGILSLTCINEQTEGKLLSKKHDISWKTFPLPHNPKQTGIRLSWDSTTSNADQESVFNLLRSIS